MILPILSYGHDVLRKKCIPVDQNYPDLDALIDNMWLTLYNANGCGLSAPQVNHPIQLFLVDSKVAYKALKPAQRKFFFEESDQGFVETFINPKIIERSAESWEDEEGCLSIPHLVQPIERPLIITVEYYDRHFVKQQGTFSGSTARMIQHEYDHIEGILYVDHLNAFTKKLLTRRLKRISAGRVPVNYPMSFR